MIYTGYFRNSNEEAITVSFYRDGDSHTEATMNLSIPSNKFRSEVLDGYRFRLLKGIFTKYPYDLTPCVLTRIRMFKGYSVTIINSGSQQLNACFTNLDEKNAEAIIIAAYTSSTYTPKQDGWIFVNLDKSYAMNVRGQREIQDIQVDNLLFADTPLTINQNSSGIYSELKLQSATVSLMTKDVYFDLYSSNPQDVYVEIYNNSKNKLLFKGYVSPNIYSQGYTYPHEQLDIECISAVSTLENFNYREEQEQVLTWLDVLNNMFYVTNVYNGFYMQKTKSYQDNYDWINEVKINQEAFFDNKKKPITWKKVLENFCKTFSLSLVEHMGELYFIDYNQIVDDENWFIKYTFGEPNTEKSGGDYTYIGIDLEYGSNSQTIELDKMYGNIALSEEIKEVNSKFMDFDDDENLVCIHPNIPYITFTSQDSTLYKDTSFQYVDIYRIYLSRNFTHMTYSSNFHNTNLTYGFNTGTTLTPSSLKFRNLTDEEQWKAQFMNYFRSHLCCFIVKHFQYKYDPTDSYNNKEPNKYSWETEYFMSYGLKGMGLGTYSDSYQEAYSTNLYRHYRAAYVLPIIKSITTKQLKTTSAYNTYLQCDGSVMFSSSQYPNTQCDKPSESLHKEDSSVYNTMNYTQAAMLYRVGIGARPSEGFLTDDNYYKVDSLGVKNIGVYPNRKRDAMYKAAQDLLFKWFPMWDTQRSFKENVLDIKGNIHLIEDDYEGIMNIYPPMPYIASNNLQVNFAYLKGISITLNRSWPIDIAISGKKPDTKIEKDNKTGYYNTETFKLEIPYITQTADKPTAINALLRSDGQFLDDMNFDYYPPTHDSLENYAIYRYKTRYEKPRVIYNAEFIYTDYNIKPYYIYTYSHMHKDFFLDSYEFDVRWNKINLKLVEKV